MIAALVAIALGELIRRANKRWYQRRAHNVFGAVRKGSDIIIELATWQVPAADRSEMRLEIAFPSGVHKFHGPNHLAALSDVAVAAFVARASVDAYGAAPRITGVDDERGGEPVTRIFVGSPIVNPQVASLLDTAVDFPVRFVRVQEDESSGAASYIVRTRLDGTIEELHSDEAHDYAVVARFPQPGHEGHFEFIVAGNHEHGTEGAGAWLAANWRRFNGATPRCGALLKVNRARPTESIVELGSRGLLSVEDAGRWWRLPWRPALPQSVGLDDT